MIKSLVLENNKNWSDEVQTKFTPKKDIFKQSSEEIAEYFYNNSKDLKQALARINFYLNRAGKNLKLEDKTRIEKAKDILRSKYIN
jgi:hypothetical protein